MLTVSFSNYKHMIQLWGVMPAGTHLFNVNKRNIKTMHEICSKLTITLSKGVL